MHLAQRGAVGEARVLPLAAAARERVAEHAVVVRAAREERAVLEQHGGVVAAARDGRGAARGAAAAHPRHALRQR